MFWKGREHCNINSIYNFFLAYFGGRRSGIGRMTGTIAISPSVLMRMLRQQSSPLATTVTLGTKQWPSESVTRWAGAGSGHLVSVMHPVVTGLSFRGLGGCVLGLLGMCSL